MHQLHYFSIHAVLANISAGRFSISNVNEVIIVIIIGLVVGFLSGLLGKGGSALMTPALQVFAAVPPLLALASPLPSTLPTTLSASFAYKGNQLLNKKLIIVSILVGIPATLAGSFASEWVGGYMLMILTAIFVCSLGLSFIIPILQNKKASEIEDNPQRLSMPKTTLIALFVGGLSGLLANSGGILFGPLFIKVLKLPTKQALACSLMVAAGLAIPGTLAHWWLGHIDWWIVLILSAGSIPSSYLGAKLALKLKNNTLELIFGIMLCMFGAYDLYFTIHPM
jgi:uncharacterized protein